MFLDGIANSKPFKNKLCYYLTEEMLDETIEYLEFKNTVRF